MSDEQALIADLRNAFSYNADSGLLTRKYKAGHHRAGTGAGYLRKDGYVDVTFRKVHYLAHRVAWAITCGYWPIQVDHKNLNTSDNRWDNLREATMAGNNCNKNKMKSNTTGFKGVKLEPRTMRYVAKIQSNRKYFHLGCFATAEEASIAYQTAARRLHGEFARF